MSFITAIDHLRISVADLGEATAAYAALLGATPGWQGVVDGDASAVFPAGNLHVVLREHPAAGGLDAVCFRVAGLERARRRLPRVGLPLSASAPGDPLAALHDSGAELLALDPAATRGLAVSLVERTGTAVPGEAAVLGLDHVVVNSRNAEGTAFLLAAQLGLDMRMDLSNADWGARLLFFRCGDLVVEVAAQLDSDDGADEDVFYGLSWRVASAEEAQQRLGGAGADVSEVRVGRKPGTSVFTVRSGAAGVPTLMLQPRSGV